MNDISIHNEVQLSFIPFFSELEMRPLDDCFLFK